MKSQKLGFVLILLGLATVGLGLTQLNSVVQDYGALGSIDWTQQFMETTGVGVPDTQLPLSAQRAAAIEDAKMNAQENLFKLAKKINLNASHTVEETIAQSPALAPRLKNVLRHFTVTDIRNLSTGEVEVDVNMPIIGPFSDLLMPAKFGGGKLLVITRPLCPLCGQPWPEGKPVPEGVQLIMPQSSEENVGLTYTGLIVDVRGFRIEPALLPKIIDDQDYVIYSSDFARRDYAVDIGMVLYLKDLKAAMENERVKDRPLVVKALKVTGARNTDVVISHSDALLIHGAAGNKNFLQRCRVIFVVD